MSIQFEGYTETEVLLLPNEHLETLLLSGEPVVLRAGSAQLLATFRRDDLQFQVELAYIDGGGEGVLLSLIGLGRKVALRFGRTRIGWTVYAVDCARPNLKLRRVLTRRGFEIAGSGYTLMESLR